MNYPLKSASGLIFILQSKNLIRSIEKIPLCKGRMSSFLYVTYLKSTVGYGISLLDPTLALIRSICEAVERYAGQWKNKGKKFRRVKGFNLTKDKEISIPAQLIYTDYPLTKSERPLYRTVKYGSGAAVGKDITSAKISGLYELIERDAFMTHILTETLPEHIEINTLPFRWMNKIQKILKEDSLSIDLFEITNDLEIPSYLTILTNKNRLIVSIGLRSNLERQEAIFGSIEEALLEWTVNKNVLSLRFDSNKLDQTFLKTVLQRYLGHKSSVYKKSHSTKCTPRKELLHLIKFLERKEIEIYSIDITPDFLRNSLFRVQKILAPKLQPLFLTASEKKIRPERLAEMRMHKFTSG